MPDGILKILISRSEILMESFYDGFYTKSLVGPIYIDPKGTRPTYEPPPPTAGNAYVG